ncbi:MAG: polyphosphate polymerase domain-containing protein [Oscillospiraceae bacterium]|nr:polyphosphate polymerase domain-containing protein [Oscillospiraceae bacterium]MDY2847680.1 polyphosphate polymerase domain-containing protein [Oscillospiraceae bacterium]
MVLMKAYQNVFRRVERKYILDEEKYRGICSYLDKYFLKDRYFQSTICNIYYDTPDRQLVRSSLEKPVYKEKLRLRSYGVPDDDTKVFLELKKKYKGVVYKRRTDMTVSRAVDFIDGKIFPDNDSQIEREIKYFLDFYGEIEPAMFLSCDRKAYYSAEDPDFRLTFDENITYRTEDIDLRSGVYGKKLLNGGEHIMELKIPNAMPVWFAHILTELCIYPGSFSKYGSAYEREFLNYINPERTNCYA